MAAFDPPVGTLCMFGQRCRDGDKCRFVHLPEICIFQLNGVCRTKNGRVCKSGRHAQRVNGSPTIWSLENGTQFKYIPKTPAKDAAAKDSSAVPASPPASESVPAVSASATVATDSAAAVSSDTKEPASPARTKQRITQAPGAPHKQRNPNKDRRFPKEPKEDALFEAHETIDSVEKLLENSKDISNANALRDQILSKAAALQAFIHDRKGKVIKINSELDAAENAQMAMIELMVKVVSVAAGKQRASIAADPAATSQ